MDKGLSLLNSIFLSFFSFSFESSDGYVKVLRHDTAGGLFSSRVVLENFDINISTNFYMYLYKVRRNNLK